MKNDSKQTLIEYAKFIEQNSLEIILNSIYSVQFILSETFEYIGVQLLLAGNGPTIILNTDTNTITAYTASGLDSVHFTNSSIDNYYYAKFKNKTKN